MGRQSKEQAIQGPVVWVCYRVLDLSICAQNAGSASTMPRAKVYCCSLLWLRKWAIERLL